MTTLRIPVLNTLSAPYLGGMDDERRTAYKTSEAARELGISAEWLRKGEERGFFPPARRDPTNGHRYYTRKDLERLRRSRQRGEADDER